MNDTTIGALVNTSSQVSLANHKLKILPLSPARVAFLALIRLNVWGLATLLSKKAFLVDAATTANKHLRICGGMLEQDLEMLGGILAVIGINLFLR